MKYSIPEKRKLSKIELDLLIYLSNKENVYIDKIEKLKVIAKCGCGKCPTILFGETIESKIEKNQKLKIDYFGKDSKNNLIGVSVFGNEEIPTELEFYSIDGKSDLIEIPKIETLQPINYD